MAKEPELLAHLEWLGYIQPVGLVVSAPALLNAQAHVNKNIAPQHSVFLSVLPTDDEGEIIPEIVDFPEFVQAVFEWEKEDIRRVPVESLPQDFAGLEIVLPEYNETLRPTYAVPAFEPAEDEPNWIALVKEVPTDTDLDDDDISDSRRWQASPHSRFERLLRETEIPFGILTNRQSIRLVYAPRGETSGYMTFNLPEMTTVAGRPIFAALHMLLCAPRMFSLDKNQRLPAILEDSRKYQNTVSTELAEQVMAALFELLRGFQAAQDASQGQLLSKILEENPQLVYHGLLTILMRMVFVLYAEDRGLLSNDSVYVNHYSVSGLFDRLREDAGRFPDTMDQRFGAYAQLLTLFRLIYEGGSHGDLTIPARKGYLFDPDRYSFLEGRVTDDSGKAEPLNGDADRVAEKILSYETAKAIEPRSIETEDFESGLPDHSGIKFQIPRVSDGVIYRVLNNLLILQGERLSYRTLDVEQIGSVYEAIMGFELEVATGKSIAIKPAKRHGAPATINLDALLQVKEKDRSKWIKERTDQKISGTMLNEIKASKSTEELLAALDRKIAKHVTPNTVPSGAMVFQPSDERRRSGSHYTPRSLTAPIVEKTLEPILKRFVDPDSVEVAEPKSKGRRKKPTRREERKQERLSAADEAAQKIGIPHPRQILELKVCDPAMGSGAFLVEACRQLSEHLVKAWHAHDLLPPDIPKDEDELLHARRMIAQRCLYGVDKNPMAVDLAKLSLWLTTLAAEHPFTFLDHSLRFGDSLVGLSRSQIVGFHWEVKKQRSFGEDKIQERLERATEARKKILDARDDVPYRDQEQRLEQADTALNVVRLVGDACVSAFFEETTKTKRNNRCDELFNEVVKWFESGRDPRFRGDIASAAESLLFSENPISPFHWEIEYPEVFARENGGFDAFVGNPPFLGGKRITGALGTQMKHWLAQMNESSSGNADLVSHFFRMGFSRVRHQGTVGLIATNTIAQGDTRRTGLRWIANNGGTIYAASRRFRWPGVAAVVVSIVHLVRGSSNVPMRIDGKRVERITAFLFHQGSNDDPHRLHANSNISFVGCDIKGQGFLFDDTDPDANTVAEMHRLLNESPKNQEVIRPYLGGSELNGSPTLEPSRWVIHFDEMSLDEAKQWPEVLKIVELKVRAERKTKGSGLAKWPWWQFWRVRKELYDACIGKSRVVVCAQTSRALAFSFLSPEIIFSHKTIVLAVDDYASYGCIQSRPHIEWAYFFGSTMKDDPVYTPSDCFDNFPFPSIGRDEIAECARVYYDLRNRVMIKNGEGITDTLNRFDDPNENSTDIRSLRERHDELDRTVLRSYGWSDLANRLNCEFILDFEEDQDESSRRRKPWRYRWPDEFRDEVLARLLVLNEQRHKEEVLAGEVATEAEKKSKPKKKTTKKKAEPAIGNLFAGLEPEENYIMLLLSTWNKRVTRHALENGLLLLINNKLRQANLGKSDPPTRTKTVPALNDILAGLATENLIDIDNSGSQQVLTLGSREFTGKPTTAEKKRIKEVMQVFEQAAQEGKVTATEEIVDAEPEFVLA